MPIYAVDKNQPHPKFYGLYRLQKDGSDIEAYAASSAIFGTSRFLNIEGGKFGGGTFQVGTFWGGTFEGGTFWGGTFWGGTFKDGTFEGGTFRGGMFWDGTFRGGSFWGGTFWGGMFEGGTFKDGTFRGGMFEGGTFEGGTFDGGTFRGGMFWGGKFERGSFKDGTFFAGTFRFALVATRSDGWTVTYNWKDGAPAVAAGCQYLSFPEARKENAGRLSRSSQLVAEGEAILDHLEKVAKLTGVWENME